MNNLVVIGIDPGTQGGLVALEPNGTVFTLPFSRWSWHEIACELFEMKLDAGRGWNAHAYIEELGTRGRNAAGAMRKYHRAGGIVEGIIIALNISYEIVPPAKWCAEFGMKKGANETKSKWKNRLKAKSHELFPGYVSEITTEVADAVLIAEYGRRMRTGTLRHGK